MQPGGRTSSALASAKRCSSMLTSSLMRRNSMCSSPVSAKRSAALPPCSMWTGRNLRISAPAASTTLKNSVWTMASGGTAWGRPCSGSARQKPNAGALTGWSLTSGHLMKTRRNSTKQWDFRPIAAISSCRSTARREAKRQTEKQKRRGTMPHGMIPRLFVHRGDSQIGLSGCRRRMWSVFSSGKYFFSRRFQTF